MRRTVGAEEEFRQARAGGLQQRLPVFLALEHRQTVVVRPQAPGEQRIAVVEQVLGREGGGGEAVRLGHVLRRLLGGDVLEHDLELGHGRAQRRHHAVDEHGLAVEDVDVGVGHLAVHEQQQALALHRLQRRVGLAQVGHAGVAVGGGAGRVELEGDDTGLLGTPDLVRRRVVGQVHRHQRLEVRALGPRGQDALAIGQRLSGRCDGRPQIGHHDGTGKLPRGVRQHTVQRGFVAQVQMPVVRAGEGEGVVHGAGLSLPKGLSSSRASQSMNTRTRRGVWRRWLMTSCTGSGAGS
mmetsp:Transcript_16910/g.40159  ORF Transcript_16910/g.40159 Transcript_16910/m.40159 type:complete len:295 (+) Transcript_16910:853-1737(+)